MAHLYKIHTVHHKNAVVAWHYAADSFNLGFYEYSKIYEKKLYQ
jgi:hypothetical protein